MTRVPRSVVGSIAGWGLLARFRNRALVFGAPIALCAILAFFPERYLALSTLTPSDPQSLGLSGTLGQLGAANNVFGSQAAIEVSLRIGGSVDVRNIVIAQLGLQNRLGKSNLQLQRWLTRMVDVHALRGGIIQIDMQNTDPRLALDIVAAYASAIRERLSQISRAQTSYKRDLLVRLVRDASGSLAEAQTHYDLYRLQHRDAVPEAQTETVAQRIATLESSIHGKEIAIATARQIYTDQNITVEELRAELAAMSQQLERTRATAPGGSQNVGSVVASTSVLYRLQRELTLQRTLYDSYMRFLQGTSVEDLVSSANVRILEPPHIDSERQYWMPALTTAFLLVLLWGGIEFYILRPPLAGRRKVPDAAHRTPADGSIGETTHA